MPSTTNQRSYQCSLDGCDRPGYARNLCGPHYQRLIKYGNPLAGRRPVDGMSVEAWLAHYTERAPDGCLLWTGGLSTGGYGQAKGTSAHRFVWEHHNGSIPDGMEIDHECHNNDDTCSGFGVECLHRRCVEITHLAMKTRQDNMAAAAPKRRKTHCSRGHLFDYRNARGHGVCRQCDALRHHSRRANTRDVPPETRA